MIDQPAYLDEPSLTEYVIQLAQAAQVQCEQPNGITFFLFDERDRSFIGSVTCNDSFEQFVVRLHPDRLEYEGSCAEWVLETGFDCPESPNVIEP